MKINKFKLCERGEEFFFFCPVIYTCNKKRISFALELFGARYLYIDINLTKENL